jgi:hypothetical protein
MIAGAVLLAGVFLAAGMSRFGYGDGVFIALLLTPLLVFGVASGLVQEFTGPGGWGAKFRQAASKEIDEKTIQYIEDLQAEDFQEVTKGSVQSLSDRVSQLHTDKPISLFLKTARQGHYQQSAVKKYIEELGKVGPIVSIVVVDGSNHFIAAANAEDFLRSSTNEGVDVINAVENEDIDYFRRSALFTTTYVTESMSNAEVLSLMQENCLDRIILVKNSIPKGVIKRNDLVARLVVELAKDKK